MADGTKHGSFPWDIMLLAAIGLYLSTFMLSFEKLPLTLGDTDNAMRLVQLREFLAHGNWYDLHTDRLSPGLGYTSHWSRLPDLVMAMIYKVVLPFSSIETAEWAVRAFYPGLWIIPALIAISLFAFKVTGNRLVVVATLIIVALCATAGIQFVAGRIDHHNAQIALSLLAVVATSFIKLDWRYAIVAGLCSAMLLTIGLEALPFLMVSAAVIAIRYIVWNAEPKATKAYTLSFAGAILIGLAISLPPGRWLETACDSLAFNLAAPVTAGSLVLLIWANSQKLSTSITSRCVGVGLAAVVAAGIYAKLDPACLTGPFGHVNPLVKPLWLDHVQEMQPLFTWGNASGNLSNLLFVYPAMLALFGSIWLLRKPAFRTNVPLITMVLAFLVSLMLGLLNLRMAAYIPWYAAPLICVALFALAEDLGRRRTLYALPLMLALSPFALEFWLTPAVRWLVLPATSAASAQADCSASKNFDAVAKLPRGLIMAELDMGSYLLALTPHSVVAAPYHRISDSILQDIQFFATDTPEQARDVAEKSGIDYVLICNEGGVTPFAKQNANLGQELRAGRLPDWLTPVLVEKGNPLQVYAVNQDQTLAMRGSFLPSEVMEKHGILPQKSP
jgi:hypothetical protein